MSAERDTDPEVAADLRLRDTTQRERSRALVDRERADRQLYDWTPEPIVGQWRCRRPGCGGWIPVNATDMATLAKNNAMLRSWGMEPLDLTAPVTVKERACRAAFCAACRTEYDRQLPGRRRKLAEQTAAKVRELKESRDPAGEREILLQLRELGYNEGELRDLVQAVATSKAATKPRREL